MVTVPTDAADDPDVVCALMDAGMDVARVTCAHDGPAAWARMAENVRAASAVSGRAAGVSMDLPGPMLRTGPILDRMDQAQTKSRALMRHIHSWDNR